MRTSSSRKHRRQLKVQEAALDERDEGDYDAEHDTLAALVRAMDLCMADPELAAEVRAAVAAKE